MQQTFNLKIKVDAIFTTHHLVKNENINYYFILNFLSLYLNLTKTVVTTVCVVAKFIVALFSGIFN